MVNVLADYTFKDGQWGHNEYQVTGVDDIPTARDIVLNFLEAQGLCVEVLSIVHGEHTIEELEQIHASPENAKGKVIEMFVYDL